MAIAAACLSARARFTSRTAHGTASSLRALPPIAIHIHSGHRLPRVPKSATLSTRATRLGSDVSATPFLIRKLTLLPLATPLTGCPPLLVDAPRLMTPSGLLCCRANTAVDTHPPLHNISHRLSAPWTTATTIPLEHPPLDQPSPYPCLLPNLQRHRRSPARHRSLTLHAPQ